MYEKKTDKRGRVLYFKDKKMVSVNSIPEDAAIIDRDFGLTIDHTSQTDKVELGATNLPTEDRTCIFTGEPGTHQRYVNGQLVWLNEEMYATKTLGEVAQQLRETTNG